MLFSKLSENDDDIALVAMGMGILPYHVITQPDT
jgi:hypothetical protein